MRTDTRSSMKRNVKMALTVFSVALTFPFWMISRLEEKLSTGDSAFRFFGQALSLIPGTPGSFIRRGYYIAALRKCDWEFHMDFGSFFAHREVTVGHKVIIGAFSVLGCVALEDGVLIASRVSVTSGKNQHYDREGNITGAHTFETVRIGKNTWVGEGSVVMANIGGECIVSAGSVVTKDAPDNIIAVGNPARFMPRFKAARLSDEEKTTPHHATARVCQ